MQYTYEFELWRGEKQWCIAPFGLLGATQGEDIQDACESAADWLRGLIEDYLMRGEEPPKPTFGNEPKEGAVAVVVSVEASLGNIPKVSATQAAQELGVSRSRISKLLADGLLEGWREGRNTWVTRASLDARLSQPREVGRPKKLEVA